MYLYAMKNCIVIALLFCSTIAWGQYHNPYRMTYDGNNFLVTNKGNGAVTRIDTNNNTTFPITGLSSPNDIVFGSLGGNSVLLIVDNNTIKVYNPVTYALLTQIQVTGCTEAHDIAFNPTNSNIFYISDRAGGKILKGTIGPAPFYQVSYTTLTSSVIRPAGMIVNHQGELMVVSDTLLASIYTVNLSNGNVQSQSTALDNLNDIAQDGQKNYYVTCWGDDNLYRFNSALGQQYTVSSYNNPSGLLADLTYDYLGICCYNCQKVEFKFFHLFTPLGDIVTCAQDSFYADFQPTYTGIGTYEDSNRFVVELSDTQGNFPDAQIIGFDSTTIRPSSIPCFLPAAPYGAGYRYRIRSTHPEVISYFDAALTVKSSPYIPITPHDPYRHCGYQVSLGDTSSGSTTYHWSPGHLFSDSTISNPVYQATQDGDYSIALNMVDTISGCDTRLEAELQLASLADYVSIQDSVSLCYGDSIILGNSSNHNFVIRWMDRAHHPHHTGYTIHYHPDSSHTLHWTVQDSLGICTLHDSIVITVNPLPDPHFITQDFSYCYGDTILLTRDTTHNYILIPSKIHHLPLIDSTGHGIRHLADTQGNFPNTVTVVDRHTGCTKIFHFNHHVLPVFDSLVIEKRNGYLLAVPYPSTQGGTFRWTLNGSTTGTSGDTLHSGGFKTGDVIRVTYVAPSYCGVHSKEWVWPKSNGLTPLHSTLSLHPNPALDYFEVVLDQPFQRLVIIDLNGRTVFQDTEGIQKRFDVSGLAPGVYSVLVDVKENRLHQTLVIQ